MVEEIRFKMMQDISILPLQLYQYWGVGWGEWGVREVFGMTKSCSFNLIRPRRYLLM